MESQQENSDRDLYIHQEIQVDEGQSMLRIDKYLMDRLQRVSRNKIQNAIRAGAILVNGLEVKPNYKIKPLDRIVIVLPEPPRIGEAVAPEQMELDILYEDPYLLVLNKPAGMVVHPGIGNHSGTLVNGLAYHLSHTDLPVMPGNLRDRPGLVHRIDKDTSGLLVIAKDDYTMTHLARQFFRHTIERKYLALVWGEPEDERGTIDVPIGRHPRYRMLMHAFHEGEDGKSAVTHYRVVERLYYVSLVECELETGRTHQIRVHMKYLGHPVFQDSKYDGDMIRKGTVYTKYRQFVDNCFQMMQRQALHAHTLGFFHPVLEKEMHFEAPLPGDFTSVLEKWRKYVNRKRSAGES